MNKTSSTLMYGNSLSSMQATCGVPLWWRVGKRCAKLANHTDKWQHCGELLRQSRKTLRLQSSTTRRTTSRSIGRACSLHPSPPFPHVVQMETFSQPVTAQITIALANAQLCQCPFAMPSLSATAKHAWSLRVHVPK